MAASKQLVIGKQAVTDYELRLVQQAVKEVEGVLDPLEHMFLMGLGDRLLFKYMRFDEEADGWFIAHDVIELLEKVRRWSEAQRRRVVRAAMKRTFPTSIAEVLRAQLAEEEESDGRL